MNKDEDKIKCEEAIQDYIKMVNKLSDKLGYEQAATILVGTGICLLYAAIDSQSLRDEIISRAIMNARKQLERFLKEDENEIKNN